MRSAAIGLAVAHPRSSLVTEDDTKFVPSGTQIVVRLAERVNTAALHRTDGKRSGVVVRAIRPIRQIRCAVEVEVPAERIHGDK